ncbi:MAG: hypothetical protein PHS53_05100 [Candidatus Pacebacteria bacterium]|nr:hypothetical protein [Candidatus Paceibacterota bacterium]
MPISGMPSQTTAENPPTTLREDFEKASLPEIWGQFVHFSSVVGRELPKIAQAVQASIIEANKRTAEENLSATPAPAGKSEWTTPNIQTGVKPEELIEFATRDLVSPGGSVSEMVKELNLLTSVLRDKLMKATPEERALIAGQKIG